MKRTILATTVIFCTLAGCGGTDTNGRTDVDAGPDAGLDAGMDAGEDAGGEPSCDPTCNQNTCYQACLVADLNCVNGVESQLFGACETACDLSCFDAGGKFGVSVPCLQKCGASCESAGEGTAESQCEPAWHTCNMPCNACCTPTDSGVDAGLDAGADGGEVCTVYEGQPVVCPPNLPYCLDHTTCVPDDTWKLCDTDGGSILACPANLACGSFGDAGPECVWPAE